MGCASFRFTLVPTTTSSSLGPSFTFSLRSPPVCRGLPVKTLGILRPAEGSTQRIAHLMAEL